MAPDTSWHRRCVIGFGARESVPKRANGVLRPSEQVPINFVKMYDFLVRSTASVAVLATLGVPVVRARPEVEVPGECGSLDELESALRRLTGDSDLQASAVRVAIEPKDVEGMFTLRVAVDDQTRMLRDV